MLTEEDLTLLQQAQSLSLNPHPPTSIDLFSEEETEDIDQSVDS